MNRGLLVGLAGTCALSVWVLLNPASPSNEPSTVVAAASPVRTRDDAANTALAVAPASDADALQHVQAAGGETLPVHWPTVDIEPATRNPFIATPPPAPKAVAAVAVAVAAPPPAPPLPVSNYRFWGRMLVQGHQPQTFIARGEAGPAVAVEPGMRLEDGWSVESVGDNAIVLVHAATQQRSTLAIPLHTSTN